MPLILQTPPAAEPVSLAEAKSHLRVAHSNDDAYIDKLLVAARRLVEARTDVRLMAQDWSLFIDRWPDDGVISLGLSPVSVVDDIITYGESDTPATLDPAHYYLDAASRPARVVLRDGRNVAPPGRRLNGIEVRFTAGFGTTAASVPQELTQAIQLTVAAWHDNRGDGDGGSLPLAAAELLSAYRLVRLT